MIDRRTVLLAVSAMALTAGVPHARAATPVPFADAAFTAALEQGKPVLVAVTAPWCPTCKMQKQVLADLEGTGTYQTLIVFEIDFDSQKDLLRRFNVQQQSTLIAFKGGKEAGRSVGQTGREAIAELLNKAM